MRATDGLNQDEVVDLTNRIAEILDICGLSSYFSNRMRVFRLLDEMKRKKMKRKRNPKSVRSTIFRWFNRKFNGKGKK